MRYGPRLGPAKGAGVAATADSDKTGHKEEEHDGTDAARHEGVLWKYCR